jgi:hypothetical protein
MKNNYIISVDLNKIYHNTIEEYNQTVVNDKLNLSQIHNKLHDLIIQHYTLDAFDFTENVESFKEDFIVKFNLNDSDLVLLDKTIYLNSYLGQHNQNKFLSYDQGIILLDLSMMSDQNIVSNINFLFKNYSKISLNKIYDNYLINFRSKQIKPKEFDSNTSEQFNVNLLNMFYDDLLNINLWQKIQNIPHKINNPHMAKKLDVDLSYMDNVKKQSYMDFYSGIDRKYGLSDEFAFYEKSIYLELKALNEINYDLDSNIKEISKPKT